MSTELTELEEAKNTISIFQRRQIRAIDTKVIIQVAIGSLLICNKEITEYFYKQHSNMTRNDWHYELKANHAENYEFIEEIFKLAKEREILIKITFSGTNGTGGCTFSATSISEKSAYCVKRFFKAWAEAWQRAVATKGMLLDKEKDK